GPDGERPAGRDARADAVEFLLQVVRRKFAAPERSRARAVTHEVGPDVRENAAAVLEREVDELRLDRCPVDTAVGLPRAADELDDDRLDDGDGGWQRRDARAINGCTRDHALGAAGVLGVLAARSRAPGGKRAHG